MILITGEWMENPQIKAEVTGHPLGAPIWNEIGRAHELLVKRRKERMALEARLAQLVELVTKLDSVYNSRARVLRNLLVTLAEATNNPEHAAFYRELDELLFPHQLRIINMSYYEQAGAALELEHRVTPDILRRLEEVRVGDQTLADIFHSWIEAGKELGRHAQERARVEASLSRNGSMAPQTYSRQVRSAWIRAVRLLLDALDSFGMSTSAREMLLAPLEKGVNQAIARRERASSEDESESRDESESESAAGSAPGEPAGDEARAAVGTTPGEPAGDESAHEDLAAEREAPAPSTHAGDVNV